MDLETRVAVASSAWQSSQLMPTREGGKVRRDGRGRGCRALCVGFCLGTEGKIDSFQIGDSHTEPENVSQLLHPLEPISQGLLRRLYITANPLFCDCGVAP